MQWCPMLTQNPLGLQNRHGQIDRGMFWCRQTFRYGGMIDTSLIQNVIEIRYEYTIGPRSKYVTLDLLNVCILYSGPPGNDCTKDKTTAEKIGCLLVLFRGLQYNHFLGFQKTNIDIECI